MKKDSAKRSERRASFSGRRGLQEKEAHVIKDDGTVPMKAQNELHIPLSKDEDCVFALNDPFEETELSDSNAAMEHQSESAASETSTHPGRRGDPRASVVGAHAIEGPGTLLGDLETGTVIIGGSARTALADPVEDDGLEEEIREEVQAEMQRKLETQIATAEEVDLSETTLQSSTKSLICTRRYALIAAGVIALAIIGLVVGLLLARERQEPTDPNTIQGTNAGDRFGDFIVLSRDGTTLAVGSDKKDYARVFRRINNGTEWSQIGEALIGDGQFGRTMDFNRNASMLVVGSWSNDKVAEKAGKAQVFGYSGTGWDPVGQDLFGDASQDRFGYFVSMSGDGRRIAVSARNTDPSADKVDAGTVRLYERNITGQWIQVVGSLKGEFANEQFGKRMTMNENGTRVAVSSVRWNEKKRQGSRL